MAELTLLNQNPEPYVKIEAIAANYDLPLSWFYAPARRRGPNPLPVLKCGKYLRCRPSDVENWMKRQQVR